MDEHILLQGVRLDGLASPLPYDIANIHLHFQVV
jgi:hypothetical protein